MPKRTCSVAICERVVVARGWCSSHYARWRSYGDPLGNGAGRVYPSAHDRFWSKVNKNGPVPEHRPDLGRCWVWTRHKNADRPYGRFAVGGGTKKVIGAHKWAYEEEHGSVPEGLELDHLCRNVSCVRPSHLEAVTHLVNCRRGISGGRQKAKTHCPQGHEYDEQNTYISAVGGRMCKACHRERQHEIVLANQGPGKGSWQRSKTHCPQGHLYNSVNTYTYRGGRKCRVCHRERTSRKKAS